MIESYIRNLLNNQEAKLKVGVLVLSLRLGVVRAVPVDVFLSVCMSQWASCPTLNHWTLVYKR